MLSVEQWAEIRHLALVKKLSQGEIRRRTGASRDTIRKAVNSDQLYRATGRGPSGRRSSTHTCHGSATCLTTSPS